MESPASVVLRALTSDAPRFQETTELRSRVGTASIDLVLGGGWYRLTAEADVSVSDATLAREVGDLMSYLLGELPSPFTSADVHVEADDTLRLDIGGGTKLFLVVAAVSEPITAEEHNAESGPDAPDAERVLAIANASPGEKGIARMLGMEAADLTRTYGHDLGPWAGHAAPGGYAFSARCARCDRETVQQYRSDGSYASRRSTPDAGPDSLRRPCAPALVPASA